MQNNVYLTAKWVNIGAHIKILELKTDTFKLKLEPILALLPTRSLDTVPITLKPLAKF